LNTQLHIIDALGPFFINKPKTQTINWSKVMFSELETKNRLTGATKQSVLNNFQSYLKTVSQLGYDSISLDDLAHLVNLPFYSKELQQLINDYRDLYRNIFSIAKSYNLKIFINTDYLFFNKDIDTYLNSSKTTSGDLYMEILEKAFIEYPEIDGLILRIGENDGKDVSGNFLSRLMLHTPRQANRLLKQMLPLFEHHNKKLIFRTWTVGAYKIGDLIWNEKTFDTVFSSIDSQALIISMKFGDTDFMRHLELNPLFFRGSHKKIIELQTRREWEGMGTYPSFVGWDYKNYLDKLITNEHFTGIHVWCQTGGWAKSEWSNVTYLKNSSFWNELNTEVTIMIAKQNISVEKAIERYCIARNIEDYQKFIKLLQLSDIAIKKGLYIAQFAGSPLYFRRTRIPPLLWLTWDTVHLPGVIVNLHTTFTSSQHLIIHEGDEAVTATSSMINLAKELNLPQDVLDSLKFEHETLLLFSSLRRYVYKQLAPDQVKHLNGQIEEYTSSFPQHYSIPRLTHKNKSVTSKAIMKPLVRNVSAYRKRDRLLLKTSPIQAQLIRAYLIWSRSRLANQAMGLDSIFK
jgi:hypothetical protein